MSAQGPVYDLNPNKDGTAPEGFQSAEVTVSREEKERAIRQIASITAFIADTQGPAAAIKNLMLGVEASLVAMRGYTTTAQVLAIIDHIRDNFVTLDARIEAVKAIGEPASDTKH